MKGIIAGIVSVVVLILVASTFFGSWYNVDETERGVLLRNGAVVGDAAIGPGLHFKMPFIEAVDTISIQSNSLTFEKVEAYSFDKQVAFVRVSVNYRVDPADAIKIRKEYVTTDNLVRRVVWTKVPAIFKNVFGTYTADTAIQQRPKLNADVLAALQAGLNAPLIIDSIQIEDIKFSDAYEQANEQKQLQDVQVQQLQQKQKQADVQAQITVINAKANADAQVATATADATSIKLKGDAEAGVIRARGEALKDNPGIPQLLTAEKWDGKLPASMPPGGTVPFLNLTPQ